MKSRKRKCKRQKSEREVERGRDRERCREVNIYKERESGKEKSRESV